MFGDSEMFPALVLGAGKLELIKEKLEKCVWWALIGHMRGSLRRLVARMFGLDLSFGFDLCQPEKCPVNATCR